MERAASRPRMMKKIVSAALIVAMCVLGSSSVFAAGQLVGNTNTKVYHSPYCHLVDRIKNKVFFSPDDEALSNGYRHCKKC